jgi:RNA polymerase sigma-70 factor (ECF subfamily)
MKASRQPNFADVFKDCEVTKWCVFCMSQRIRKHASQGAACGTWYFEWYHFRNFLPRTAVPIDMGMPLDRIDNDASLAQACRNGDLAAFETLVERHQRMMINIAFRMTGVYEDACDIVQDAFIAAWRKIGDYRGEAQFSTWLTAIVINLSRNRLQQTQQRSRREAYSLNAPLPGGAGEALPDPPSATRSVLEQLEQAELHRFLQHCIAALTPEFREVLVLRDMQELSYEAVGSALKLREGTVKSRLFRARDALKDCLKKAVRTA